MHSCRALNLFVAAATVVAALSLQVRAQEGVSVVAAQTTDGFRLDNGSLSVRVNTAGGRLGEIVIWDRIHKAPISVESPFAVLLKDGTIASSSNLTLSGAATQRTLMPQPGAARLAEKIHGEQFDVPLETADHSLHLVWSVVLLDGSAYVRQLLSLTAGDHDVDISRVQMIDLPLPNGQVVGSVSGSPIVAGNVFVGFEQPLSESKVTAGRATAWMDRDLPLRAGQSVSYSSVIGVAHEGQMRREFLAYIERERAHPYRTFLHYNSWYDLGYFNPYDEAGAVDRIRTFGEELTKKRGVQLDSFLFDDGWDNHGTLWKFNGGFPKGFAAVEQAAEGYGADPGVWMSPWGGYSKPKQERIAFGKSAGYEIVGGGYALSGPKYYAAFRDVCMDMIRRYHVNQLKFDGTGNVDSVFPGSRFDSDFSAAINLIAELRQAKPDLFINLTTGTWPSPFWLRYADSIWRGGEDDSFAGGGSWRERWITYRDADTYQHVVQNGPLYPLNSLMLHGIIYAQHHKQLSKDPDNDFRNEVRSYFGTGTQLQEMYITPSLLTQANWDDLAEAAKWSRTNAEVLKDTHWVGGNPAWLEVYGWASWSPNKSILVLRNPSDHPQSIDITLQRVLELPEDGAQRYVASSPWKSDANGAAIELYAKRPHTFQLDPFEVLTLEMIPR